MSTLKGEPSAGNRVISLLLAFRGFNGFAIDTALGYEPLDTMDVDERVVARKNRYLRLYQKFNFFGFG
jgi:hypothetical protein